MRDHDHYLAIQNLIYKYALCLDQGDLEGVAELFKHGEILAPDLGTSQKGYDEVLKTYQEATRIYSDTGTPKTKHITSNVMIEFDDDYKSARSESYFTVIQGTESFPLQPIISGRYHDEFALESNSWLFMKRKIYIDLMGDCSAHLLYDINA
tara:strand:+ start:4707 stop:5162 length:456 start_codon:yes stop_codon:yes gene_type:complete